MGDGVGLGDGELLSIVGVSGEAGVCCGCSEGSVSSFLSLSDGCDTTLFLAYLVKAILNLDPQFPLNITAYTDNQSLYDLLYTTKQPTERRLITDIASLREMIDTKEVNVVWVDHKNQLSDVLTKSGASPHQLLESLHSAKIPFV